MMIILPMVLCTYFSTHSKNVNSLVVEENVLQISLSFDINLEALSNEITFLTCKVGHTKLRNV